MSRGDVSQGKKYNNDMEKGVANDERIILK